MQGIGCITKIFICLNVVNIIITMLEVYLSILGGQIRFINVGLQYFGIRRSYLLFI